MSRELDESDLVDRLVRHGLGQGEARCYVGMLAPRAFKVSEVANKAGLPRSRTYELIRSLVRAGLCSEVAGGTVSRFRAAPPNEVIERLEAFLGDRAQRRNAVLSSLLHALGDHQADRRRGSRVDPVEALSRPEQVVETYARSLQEAHDEICTLIAMPFEARELPEALAAVVARRLDEGLRMRTIIDRSACREGTRDYLLGLTPHGHQLRLLGRLEAQFVLFDRRMVIFNMFLTPSGERGESLLIRHDGLGETLAGTFEHLWQQASPIDSAADWPGPWNGSPPAKPAKPVGWRGNGLGPPGPDPRLQP
jgi:sugar-specific transcriptional regulator TrmB